MQRKFHQVTPKIYGFLLYMALSFFAFAHTLAFAQSEGKSGGDRVSQIGIFSGKFLPKNIDGADEIMSLSGVRYSMPFSKSGFIDMGGIFGNGQGVKWQGLFTGISMHIPVETLVGHAGIGLDLTRYESTVTDSKTVGGAHFIGGLMARIGGSCLARFDMKLNSKPGSSLYFALGFTFELGGFGNSENPGP